MKSSAVSLDDLSGVFAVPPLARRADAARTVDYEQNERLARHIVAGGITRLLYGGNAFLYHVTAPEFEWLLGWMSEMPDDVWAIPSLGPAFGHAMKSAPSRPRSRCGNQYVRYNTAPGKKPASARPRAIRSA